MVVISGLLSNQNDTYMVCDFMENKRVISKLQVPEKETFERLVHNFSGKVFPKSYTPYLLAARNIEQETGEPITDEMWDNMIFIGDYRGVYDHKEDTFYDAWESDMDAGSPVEAAYRDAVASTYHALRHVE